MPSKKFELTKQSLPILIIGGSDPSGGAGLQADLKTLNDLKVSSYSVVTAVTAQNENAFFSYEVVSEKSFIHQLESVEPFVKNGIVKIGMLGTVNWLPILKKWFKKVSPQFLIWDPVLRSSTGVNLIEIDQIDFYFKNFLSCTDLFLPNFWEAEILFPEILDFSIEKRIQLFLSKLSFTSSKKLSVLLKGGHRSGNPVDQLIDSESITSFRKKRVMVDSVHGTGCTFASAIAGFLGKGETLPDAIRKAKNRVHAKIKEKSKSRL